MLNLLGIFRVNHAAHPDDPRFDQLIEALSQASAQFVELWQRQQLAPLSTWTAHFVHPDFGDVRADSVRLPLRDGRADGATGFFFVPQDAATAASFARVAAELEQAAVPA
jgi:hypothetical protein